MSMSRTDAAQADWAERHPGPETVTLLCPGCDYEFEVRTDDPDRTCPICGDREGEVA